MRTVAITPPPSRDVTCSEHAAPNSAARRAARLRRPVPGELSSVQPGGRPPPVSSTSIRVHSALAARADDERAGLDARTEPVAQRVLDERLHDEQRHARARHARIHVDRRLQPVGETNALDVQIALDELQLVGQRQVAVPLREQRPQQLAEAGDQPHDTGGIAGARERRDAVQAVEEEVRLELAAQRVEPRRRQLRLKRAAAICRSR